MTVVAIAMLAGQFDGRAELTSRPRRTTMRPQSVDAHLAGLRSLERTP